MADQPQPADRPVLDLPRRRPRRQLPLWVAVVVVLVASPLILAGVFAIGNYVVARTTVTINLVSWSVSLNGTPLYQVSCQGRDNGGNCPYQVKPGSVYATTLSVWPLYPGRSMNVTIYAPSPFSIASTHPSLPALVSPTGLQIAVNLTLPSSPGEYSFTGNVTFS